MEVQHALGLGQSGEGLAGLELHHLPHRAASIHRHTAHVELAEFEKSGYIQWSTDVAKLVSEQGLKNVYGEIGTSFANSAVANPRFAAAFVGQLVNLMGADNVVWGTDSVWYGSPQWQIEAMRRLEIPEDMMAKTKWKTKLGDADSAVKQKGVRPENSARLYKYDMKAEYEGITHDKIALMKQEYEKEGVERNNAFYGFVPERLLSRSASRSEGRGIPGLFFVVFALIKLDHLARVSCLFLKEPWRADAGKSNGVVHQNGAGRMF